MKFNEYDVVKSKKILGNNVPSGARGTILMIFDTNAPRYDYEVEFMDQGESLAVLTVSEDDLELVQRVE